MKTLTIPEYTFLRWLREHHPDLYEAAEARQQTLSGFMDSLSSVFDSISQATPQLLETYVKGAQQAALLKLNIARAKAGQNPLDSVPVANAPGYDGGSVFSTVPTWVWIAFGLGALYLLTRK